MSTAKFINYFWYYPEVIISKINKNVLIFDERLFFSETKKLLVSLFDNESTADNYLVPFKAYLGLGVNTRRNCERVNFVMKEMYETVVKGHPTLNVDTPFSFDKKEALDALEGIFVAFHLSSLKSKAVGWLELDYNQLFYDFENRSILKFTYYKKQCCLSKAIRKKSEIEKELFFESKEISKISGNSKAMIIDLFDGQISLEVTPSYARMV